ncbi:helix-turn-helix domain-containing protein [Acidiphilium sp. AL]|uniref:helix-turn-helix transcriptional regulator n=1 Tax=Acidiphilium sp. AL TaxID=2871704 RepID=UPI0021CB9764|nr:helix-turn-helix domain-containing protein [Acidiphilium sp. AL]MCU4161813.1 helix-turn-helix domain-containing protein [Acidiphilium sp. AL]
MPSPAYLTLEEVITRYRGQVSEGTLRNWRAMRVGPSFIKIGKAILYPVSELDRWDKFNLVVCRPFRSLSLEEYASAG